MGLFDNIEKQNTANTLTLWIEGCDAAIAHANKLLSDLKAQLELMKTNTDYTIEDCNEVQTIIDRLQTKLN